MFIWHVWKKEGTKIEKKKKTDKNYQNKPFKNSNVEIGKNTAQKIKFSLKDFFSVTKSTVFL